MLGYTETTSSWMPQNKIMIDQPEKPGFEAFTTGDESDNFVMMTEEAVKFADDSADRTKAAYDHRLKLGLGIGLGLGIPLWTVATGFVMYRFGKKQNAPKPVKEPREWTSS